MGEAHSQQRDVEAQTEDGEKAREATKCEAEGKQELKLREGGRVEKHRGEKEEN